MSGFWLFYSSIGKKILVAVTGLFLTLFLVIHLAGNLSLLLTEAQGGKLLFNEYTHTMANSPLIKAASYITYLSILLHAILGILFSTREAEVRPIKYQFSKGLSKSSIWASRNMGVLGAIILAFVVFHLYNFWWKMKFGSLPVMVTDHGDIKDLYTVVVTHFKQPIFVLLYVVSMAVIAFHLKHGFQSGFQTLGMNHPKYTPVVKTVGMIVSIVIPAGFAVIPIYIYLMH